MFKKKDQLLQCLKKNGDGFIYSFLDGQDLLNLALCSQKYYLSVNPILTIYGLDYMKSKEGKYKTKEREKQKIKNKTKAKNEQKKLPNQKQIEVDVNRVALSKIKQNLSDGCWTRINQLPYRNTYLEGKLESGANFFYKHAQSGRILYINRSLVDPSLNYNRGGFNSDLEEQMKTNMFSQMFEGDISDVDFASPEALKNRHKQMLEKIQKKKEQIQKMDVINYEEEFIKGITCKKIAIILCFGGSFSLGIFKQGKCIMHKSDKKYVCRKKAGQRQLNRDKQSGSQIYSMGSQIRRDQQKKHQQNVYQILTQNKEPIESCDLVFLQAPGLNRLFIINDSETLSGVKDRLRSVCLTAKKANYTQIEAIYSQITKVSFITPKQKPENK